MKKSILLACLLLGSTALFQGCKKDDATAPDITLLGDNPYSLEMLETYIDPGATANDGEDGDVTNSITVDATEIDNRLPGTYQVHYEAVDAAGNTGTAEREVTVYASSNALADTYSVLDTTIVGSSSSPFASTQTVTAVNATTIQFTYFYALSNNNSVTATINADGTIVIPSQTVTNVGSAGDDYIFSGTGYVTATGFFLNFIANNQSTSSIATVHAHYAR